MRIFRFVDYRKTQVKKIKIFACIAKGKVLDIGFAQLPNYFIDKNPKVTEVYGIDILHPLLSLPKKYIKTLKVDLNKEKIPFPKSFFNTVIIGDVIEHLNKPTECILAEINRVLIRGGLLLLSTPTPRYYLEKIHLILFGYYMIGEEHIKLLDRYTMRKKMENTGFKCIEIFGYSFWLPFLKVGIINTSFKNIPEIMTWQQIYIAEKFKDFTCSQNPRKPSELRALIRKKSYNSRLFRARD